MYAAPLQVGVVVAQPWASVVPDPVQLPVPHTQAPVGHWLSAVHWHFIEVVLQVPPAGHEGTPGAV